MQRQPHRRRPGVTLLELVVVIAAVAVLIGLLIPGVQHVRRKAAQTKTLDTLREIVIAVHETHDANKKFPPCWGMYPPPLVPGVGAAPAPAARVVGPHSLYFHILPFIGGKAIYENPPALTPAFGPYLSSLDPTTWDGTAAAAGNFYTRMPSSFLSGTSNVCFFVAAVGVPADPTAHIWTGSTAWFPDQGGSTLPRPLPAALADAVAQQPYQLAPGGTLVAMGDASTRIVEPNIGAPTWAVMCNRNCTTPVRDCTHCWNW